MLLIWHLTIMVDIVSFSTDWTPSWTDNWTTHSLSFLFFFFSYAGFSFGGLISGATKRFSTKFEYEQVRDASNYKSHYVPSLILLVFRGDYPQYFVHSIFEWHQKFDFHELTSLTPLFLHSYWPSRRTMPGSYPRPRMLWSRHWSELRPTWTGWPWTRSRCWSG